MFGGEGSTLGERIDIRLRAMGVIVSEPTIHSGCVACRVSIFKLGCCCLLGDDEELENARKRCGDERMAKNEAVTDMDDGGPVSGSMGRFREVGVTSLGELMCARWEGLARDTPKVAANCASVRF